VLQKLQQRRVLKTYEKENRRSFVLRLTEERLLEPKVEKEKEPDGKKTDSGEGAAICTDLMVGSAQL
jgi:hypothetical protein